jgi:putative intracellular protease/amidase
VTRVRPAQCKTTVRPKPRQRPSSRGSRAGFANVEEEFADEYIGRQVMPWRIEDAANDRGANYVQAGRFKPFAIRDGRLITSQQQYSGAEVAKLVVESLGT